MASQPASKGDVLQRIGGIGLILGGILTIVGNILATRPEDPASVASIVTRWASDADKVKLAFFLVVLGLWALIAGFAAIYRSITAGGASAWARLGFYGIVAATSVVSVAFGLGIAGIKEAAAGPEMAGNAGILAVATDSAFGVGFMAYWISILFIGIGISACTVYPKWTGWLLVISGVVAAITGGVLRLLGTPTSTTELIFDIGAGLTSVVALVLGILVTRREMKAM